MESTYAPRRQIRSRARCHRGGDDRAVRASCGPMQPRRSLQCDWGCFTHPSAQACWRKNPMLIRAIDFETSGEEPNIDVVETGWTNLIPVYQASETPSFWDMGPTKSLLCNPGKPITPQSCAIHHIMDEDLVGADAPDDVLSIAL